VVDPDRGLDGVCPCENFRQQVSRSTADVDDAPWLEFRADVSDVLVELNARRLEIVGEQVRGAVEPLVRPPVVPLSYGACGPLAAFPKLARGLERGAPGVLDLLASSVVRAAQRRPDYWDSSDTGPHRHAQPFAWPVATSTGVAGATLQEWFTISEPWESGGSCPLPKKSPSTTSNAYAFSIQSASSPLISAYTFSV